MHSSWPRRRPRESLRRSPRTERTGRSPAATRYHSERRWCEVRNVLENVVRDDAGLQDDGDATSQNCHYLLDVVAVDAKPTLHRLYVEEGLSADEMAARGGFDCTPTTVRKYLSRYGLSKNPDEVTYADWTNSVKRNRNGPRCRCRFDLLLPTLPAVLATLHAVCSSHVETATLGAFGIPRHAIQNMTTIYNKPTRWPTFTNQPAGRLNEMA